MGTFVHLNGRSEHSTDGYARITELVAAAKANGQTALALTDINLSGALEFRREAMRHGIKPIIGLDVRLIDGSFDNPLRATYYDLTLLAENRTGWDSLVALYNDSRANETRNGAYVDHAMLSRHAAGLIALTGGRRGPVDSHLERSDLRGAKDALGELESKFGSGRVFLEANNPASAQLLTGAFPDRNVVATGRYRQALATDTGGRHALALVRSGRPSTLPTEDWVKSDAEMRAQGKGRAWQNAVSMASAVAAAIRADAIPAPARQAPAADVPSGFTDTADYLRHLAFRGLADRYDEIPLKAIERLNVELERIIGVSGAAEYILAARDVISWCAGQGILTAARGTASSSFVLFCLGMTEINALRYDLKFDRFMRAGRDALPSLAFDVQHSRRQDVYDYLAGRWPAQVARASVISRAKAESARGRYSRVTEQNAELVDGRMLHSAAHPSAVLIAPAALTGTVPFRPDHRPGHEKDLPIALWDSQGLEHQGYLVLNLLFSSALDVINRTAEAVRAEPEGGVHMARLLPDGDGDLYWDSTDAAWDLIASGDTDGVFQIGTDAANAAAAAAQPRNLTDMAVLIALSMKPEQMDAYLYARSLRTTRYGRYEPITSDESEQLWLAGALSETCGQLVFQEQVIGLFTSVGGFSNAQAELAWRTLAKKDPDVAYIRTQFMAGAIQEQHDRAGDSYSIAFSEETAERVFDLLAKATPNAFCAAHAYSYALLALQSAWMRAHFPETFSRVLDEAQPMRKRRAKA